MHTKYLSYMKILTKCTTCMTCASKTKQILSMKLKNTVRQTSLTKISQISQPIHRRQFLEIRSPRVGMDLESGISPFSLQSPGGESFSGKVNLECSLLGERVFQGKLTRSAISWEREFFRES